MRSERSGSVSTCVSFSLNTSFQKKKRSEKKKETPRSRLIRPFEFFAARVLMAFKNGRHFPFDLLGALCASQIEIDDHQVNISKFEGIIFSRGIDLCLRWTGENSSNESPLLRFVSRRRITKQGVWINNKLLKTAKVLFF